MNPITQVRHVVAKDVRHIRWLLLLYLATLAAAAAGFVTRRALGPYGTQTNEMMGMSPVFVQYLPWSALVLGIVVAASLLQADSPTRSDTFWATRPLSPQSVLAAKSLVLATAIVAPSLVAGFVALRTFDTSGGVMSRLLVAAACGYGECLLAAMVVGAISRNIQVFISAFLGILIAPAIVLDALSPWSDPITGSSLLFPTLAGVGLALGVTLLVIVYRTRSNRWWTRLAGVVAACCALDASAAIPSIGAGRPPTNSTGPALEIEPMNPAVWGQGREIQMHVRLTPGLDADRLDFRPESVSLRLRDVPSHSTSTIPLYNNYPVEQMRGILPPVDKPVRWKVQQSNAEWPATLTAYVDEFDRQRIRENHLASVTVGGTVTLSRAHVVGSLPLRTNVQLIRDGRRIAFYDGMPSYDSTGADVWVQLSTVPRLDAAEPSRQLSLRSGLQFALVNDARAEAVLVDTPDNEGGNGGSIVVPWLDVSTQFQQLSTTTLPNSLHAAPLDSAWYAGARLVVIEWTPVGSYYTRTTVTLP